MLCIWIIGGSGVGKTTLAVNIHNFFKKIYADECKTKVFGFGEDNKEFLYTEVSPFSANLGILSNSQCSGTDTLSTKERIKNSFFLAKKNYPVVIIEGIMATGTWIDWIKEHEDVELFTIHITISDEENLKRLKIRRSKKKQCSPEEIIIEQKTKDNLSGKIRGFASLFGRVKHKSDYFLEINSENFCPSQTSDQVINFLKCKVFNEYT